MNLAITSTGFKEPGFVNIEVNAETIKNIKLPSGISNLIVHRAFHFLPQDIVTKLIQDIYLKLSDKGKFSVYCIDVYELAHRMHRRAINEVEFNNLMYEKGQLNSLSTMFFIDLCARIGFKKTAVNFHDVWAKLEFTK